MNIKKNFRFSGGYLGVHFQISWKPHNNTQVLGVCNKAGHLYVPFFDYDIKNIDAVRMEIKSLQEEYMLGNAYLFKTGRGYHVIMLDLLTYDQWTEVLDASSVEESYKKIPRTNGSKLWVLRLSEKNGTQPTYAEEIKGYLGRRISRTHWELLLKKGAPVQPLKIYTSINQEPLIYATYEA